MKDLRDLKDLTIHDIQVGAQVAAVEETLGAAAGAVDSLRGEVASGGDRQKLDDRQDLAAEGLSQSAREAAIKDTNERLAGMDGKQQPLEAKLDELAQKISVMDGTQQDALEQHVAHRQELVTHRQDLAHLQGELASGMEAAREESKGLVAQLAEVAALVAAKADRQDLAAKADSKDLAAKADSTDLAAKADRQDLAVMEGKIQEGQAKHDALAENFKEVWAEALPKIQVRQLTDQTFSWY